MSEQQRTAAWNGLDVPAILASLQDQVDELARAVQAQQRTINEQQSRLDQLTRSRGPGGPDAQSQH